MPRRTRADQALERVRRQFSEDLENGFDFSGRRVIDHYESTDPDYLAAIEYIHVAADIDDSLDPDDWLLRFGRTRRITRELP